ncbi:YajQ family cyclic di-GMP-binding protein [Candidatus Saccharibacteria bacterium]|nr:YajQ family cyclic di-GMP-binding protein [Candidatus Saccharibacteria bacterium]
MATFSFDIICDYDKAEIINVFDQSKRELDNRYDFKGTSASIDWLDNDKTGLKLTADSQYQIDAIIEIIRKKLATRNQSQKLLDVSNQSTTSNLKTTQLVPFKKGLDQDKAKKITNLIRDNLLKVKCTIQGQEVRVQSNSKDELQAVMQLLREADLDFPLNFTNYR